MLKMIILTGFIGAAGYTVHEYQAGYIDRMNTFRKSLGLSQTYQNDYRDTIVRVERMTPDVFQRNIFLSARNVRTEVKKDPDIKVTEFVQTYKVVGVVVDSQRRAIVENIKQQETVFLSIGDKLGEATITEIQADKIIGRLDGHELELLP
ncbi:MAG: hypothetical protein AB7S78_10920 [Candidatus Omnitrophota bacterium]